MENIDLSFFRKQSTLSPRGCWLWNCYIQSEGYGQIGRKGKRYLAHRLAWLVCKGPIPEGLLVRHTCDVRNCVNPDHLFLGTHKDNSQDMIAKGRDHNVFSKGHKLSRGKRLRKLTDKQINEIRKLTHWKLKHIADKFKISITHAHFIRCEKRKALVPR